MLQEKQEDLQKPTIRVAVSGAAGRIAQHLLGMVRHMVPLKPNRQSACGSVTFKPRIYSISELPSASAHAPEPPGCAAPCTHEEMPVPLQLTTGGCFGMDQPVVFQLLGSKAEPLDLLEGIAMELEDSLYPLLREACSSRQFASLQ